MFIKNWKKEVLTIPNFLSLFRFLVIPVYVSIYLQAESDSDYLPTDLVPDLPLRSY